jgi:HEPN domain-containing protein
MAQGRRPSESNCTGSRSPVLHYPNALEDVIPAEFYGEQDANQAIAMTEAVIAAVRPVLQTSIADAE